MTPRQKQVLDFIEDYIKRTKGVSPTYEEICTALELTSKSALAALIDQLIRDGYLNKTPRLARSIYLTRKAKALYAKPDKANIFAELAELRADVESLKSQMKAITKGKP